MLCTYLHLAADKAKRKAFSSGAVGIATRRDRGRGASLLAPIERSREHACSGAHYLEKEQGGRAYSSAA